MRQGYIYFFRDNIQKNIDNGRTFLKILFAEVFEGSIFLFCLINRKVL